MIYEESENIRITGNSPQWQATYSWERFDGPLTLVIDGCKIMHGCTSAFDDLTEDLVIMDQCKAYRKGHGAMIGKSGRMPIGAETSYKVSHRYSNNALKVVKDFFVPRGVMIKKAIAIDTLILDDGFVELCEYSTDLNKSEWRKVTERMQWSSTPTILCMRHKNGIVLEIGLGNDLWRWNEGFLGNGDSSMTLERTKNGIVVTRRAAVVDAETTLTARSYRFSWYLAWGIAGTSDDVPAKNGVALTHRPNGDVAMGALAASLADCDSALISLDVEKVPLPAQLCKNGQKHPCFASNQTIKRLKRIIRQLSCLQFEGDKTLRFENLRPGECRQSNHVHGKGERLHWDMNSILDFALWTRQTLGNDWRLIHDAVVDIPSLTGAFVPTDHIEPPIQYEFDSDVS